MPHTRISTVPINVLFHRTELLQQKPLRTLLWIKYLISSLKNFSYVEKFYSNYRKIIMRLFRTLPSPFFAVSIKTQSKKVTLRFSMNTSMVRQWLTRRWTRWIIDNFLPFSRPIDRLLRHDALLSVRRSSCNAWPSVFFFARMQAACRVTRAFVHARVTSDHWARRTRASFSLVRACVALEKAGSRWSTAVFSR